MDPVKLLSLFGQNRCRHSSTPEQLWKLQKSVRPSVHPSIRPSVGLSICPVLLFIQLTFDPSMSRPRVEDEGPFAVFGVVSLWNRTVLLFCFAGLQSEHLLEAAVERPSAGLQRVP